MKSAVDDSGWGQDDGSPPSRGWLSLKRCYPEARIAHRVTGQLTPYGYHYGYHGQIEAWRARSVST